MKLAAETPTRTRTRNAILTAALSVMSQDSTASLGDVAEAANVARSTLHRYFPERSDLLEAMSLFASEQLDAATRRARIEEGPAADALVRIFHEYFDQWTNITWIYVEGQKAADDSCNDDDPLDPGLTHLIARGYLDGTIDPDIPNAWLQQFVWALLYSAWEYVNQGAPKHEALTLAIRSLRKLIAQSPTNGS